MMNGGRSKGGGGGGGLNDTNQSLVLNCCHRVKIHLTYRKDKKKIHQSQLFIL